MPSVTLTVTAAEASRLQAAAAGLGYPDVKAMLVGLAKQAVFGWEQQQNASTFATTSTPIAPT